MKLVMIGHHKLREWLITTHNDVAALLANHTKTSPFQRLSTLPARHTR